MERFTKHELALLKLLRWQHDRGRFGTDDDRLGDYSWQFADDRFPSDPPIMFFPLIAPASVTQPASPS